MEENKTQYMIAFVVAIIIFVIVKYTIENKNEEISSSSAIVFSLLASVGSFFLSLFAYNMYIKRKSSKAILKTDFYS